jgi:hypothetical protein
LILPTRTQQAELYNLALDPGQTQNLIWRHADIASDMHAGFLGLLGELGADEARIASWQDALRLEPEPRS